MTAPRLSGLFIDISADRFEDGVRFWSGAFGIEPEPADAPEYVALPGAIPGMMVELQKIDGAGRYHIDFPADDVDSEAARMESLGAERVAQIASWWVMRAPTGHLFCVVPAD